MKVVAISDTHGLHRASQFRPGIVVPDGDVLVHAGDSTHGKKDQFLDVLAWMADQKPKHKIIIPGNHDEWIEVCPEEAKRAAKQFGVNLLIDEELTIGGVKFYGSPWTPKFYNWSYMIPRGGLTPLWRLIPWDTNILVTHGPPYGHGDLAPGNRHVGCLELLEKILELKNLRAHVFGHIHEGYGVTHSDVIEGVAFVNAASCNGSYDLNPPVVFQFDHT